MDVTPKMKPPRAWQARVHRASVGARRLERIEGRRGVNTGMKVVGW